MSAWLKIFSNGEKEYGDDIAISLGKSSWSKGRLDDIKEVRLINKERVCSLSISDTVWHQFDRFVTPLVTDGLNSSHKIFQAVQAEIQSCHVGSFLVSSKSGNNFYWSVLRIEKDGSLFSKRITDRDIGRWITLVLPCYDFPSIDFSPKGKINYDKHLS